MEYERCCRAQSTAELCSHVLRGQQNAKLSRQIFALQTILSFCFDGCSLSRFLVTVVACWFTRHPQQISLETINLSDTLCAARNSDSKIQLRKGWIRSLRTIAILNKPACFCFRMQPAAVGQGSSHAALLSHSARFWLVSQGRAPRQAPLCLSHRAATGALRAWLLELPSRAPATQALRAWPP